MEWLLVPAVALLASALTLFSGFGLGTLLMPAFALFFPLDLAVAMTAIVHLANNLFKLALMGRHADRSVALRFGVPAVLSAMGGAALLLALSDLPVLARYAIAGREAQVTVVRLVIAGLMLAFAAFEVLPGLGRLAFDRRYLPLGGALSGFFGGLSGHQGALRSAFLVRCGLSKEAFIGTGVVIACLVDVTRLGAYAGRFAMQGVSENWSLLAAATLAAFVGAFVGARLVPKVTYATIQRLVAALLVAIALLLAAGIV